MSVFLPSALGCVRLSEALATVPLAVSAAEWLSVHDLLRDGEPVGRQNMPTSRLGNALQKSAVGKLLFRHSGIVTVLCVKLLSALFVLFCLGTGRPALPGMTVLVCAAAIGNLRLGGMVDAADAFALNCLLALTAAEALHSVTAFHVALAFLAAQGALVYGTAGWLKAPLRGWYDGSYMLRVLSSAHSGEARLMGWLKRRRRLAASAGAALVFTECLLSVACVLPPAVCLAVLCIGLLLHASIARVLGLKTYMWAFAGTYPASFFLSTRLYHAR